MKSPVRFVRILTIMACLSAAASAQEAPRTYGTSAESYYRVGAVAFQPFRGVDGPTYTDGGFSVGTRIRRHGSGNSFFTAPVQIPSGALITSLEFNYCDELEASNRSTLKLVVTSYNGIVQTMTPEIYSVYGGCSFVLQDLTSAGIVVDNYFNSYHLFFYHNIGDGSMAITGASVGYKLQVSTEPGAATFGDVPTGHPFFQFIEALYRAGVTGGCGSGNYCPDAPVTRGQMAVFLAKALGLQFP